MVSHLADVSIRSLLPALAAVVVLWILRGRRTAALQHAVRAAVVCGMLALLAFGAALPRLTLRVLDRPATTQTAVSLPPADGLLVTQTSQTPVPVAAKTRHPIEWKDVLLYAYFGIAFVFLAHYATGMFFVRKLLKNARLLPIAGKKHVYESEAIVVPVTVGWMRPRILLPLEWREWEGEKLDAVLAHEGAHVRRHDALVAALAGANRCLFWFHPLAWLLERKLALLAEQACDEACVAALGDRERYAHLLLEMARVVDVSQGRLGRHALTMAAGSHIRQRIDSLLQEGRTFSRGLSRPGWASLMLCGVPVVLGAGAIELDRQPQVLSLEMPHWAAPAPPPVMIAQARPIPSPVRQAVQIAQVQITPQFDSVSIKLCESGDGADRASRGGGKGRGIPISPPGELYVNCLSVWELINHYVEDGNALCLTTPEASPSIKAVSEEALPGSIPTFTLSMRNQAIPRRWRRLRQIRRGNC